MCLRGFKNLRRKGGKFDHRPGRPKVLLRHCPTTLLRNPYKPFLRNLPGKQRKERTKKTDWKACSPSSAEAIIPCTTRLIFNHSFLPEHHRSAINTARLGIFTATIRLWPHYRLAAEQIVKNEYANVTARLIWLYVRRISSSLFLELRDSTLAS